MKFINKTRWDNGMLHRLVRLTMDEYRKKEGVMPKLTEVTLKEGVRAQRFATAWNGPHRVQYTVNPNGPQVDGEGKLMARNLVWYILFHIYKAEKTCHLSTRLLSGKTMVMATQLVQDLRISLKPVKQKKVAGEKLAFRPDVDNMVKLLKQREDIQSKMADAEQVFNRKIRRYKTLLHKNMRKIRYHEKKVDAVVRQTLIDAANV